MNIDRVKYGVLRQIVPFHFPSQRSQNSFTATFKIMSLPGPRKSRREPEYGSNSDQIVHLQSSEAQVP